IQPGRQPAIGAREHSGARYRRFQHSWAKFHGKYHKHTSSDAVERVPVQSAVRADWTIALSARNGLQQGGGDSRYGEPSPIFRYRVIPRLRLVGIYRNQRIFLRPTAEDSGPVHARVHGQHDLDARAARSEIRDEGPALSVARHR